VIAPVAGPATDAAPVMAPVAAPSVDDTSTNAVMGSRAVAAEHALLSGDIGSLQEDRLLAIVAPAPSWDATSGYGAVEAIRASAAQLALQSADIGSLQEETLRAIVAAVPSWDATSGYGSVEASRAAAFALLAPVTAPSWDEASGYRSVEASRATIGHPAAITTSEGTRVLAAQQALLSPDLGSLQEDALTAVVEARSAGVEASVEDALAPTSAELLTQFRTIELALSQSLKAD
jgi:hypothetical protein